MARLERGKGKRAQVITLTRSGTVLRRDEVEAGEARLTGYRRYAEVATAQAALEREIRALVGDGMRAADDEALAALPDTPAAAPALPLRRDFLVYNEATGFVITSRRMAGKTMDEGDAAWRKAVARGDLMPVALVQDDPFVLRVVAGSALEEDENAQWIARLTHHLDLKDGRLCITGGAPFSTEGYEEGDAWAEQFVAELAVPPGRYRATLYTHVHGVNGSGVRDHLAGGEAEPLADWWARTRPGEAPPDWDDDLFVGFVLHLEPVDAKPPTTALTPLPDGGWFDDTVDTRALPYCPRGLPVRDLVRTVREEQDGWTYVRDPLTAREAAMPPTLAGGPVVLPLAEFARAARIAPVGRRWSVLSLELPATSATRTFAARPWPDGIAIVESDARIHLFHADDLYGDDVFAALQPLVDALATLPPGTRLTLDVSTLGDGDTVHVRLVGGVHGDAWHISAATPPLPAEVLSAALVQAGEAAEADVAEPGDAWGDDEDEDDGLPIAGPAVFERAGGPTYAQTMALLLSDAVAAAIREREKAFRAAHMADCGDLVASDEPAVAVRAYAAQDGLAWGILRAQAPDQVAVAIVSRFADGAILITRDDNAADDDPARQLYVTAITGGRTRDLLDAHDARLTELAATLGAPLPVVPHIEQFAEAYDALRAVLV